jgi:hypothetical protein
MRLDMNLPLSGRGYSPLRKDEKFRALNVSDLAIPADAVQPPPRQAQDPTDERPDEDRDGGLNIVV